MAKTDVEAELALATAALANVRPALDVENIIQAVSELHLAMQHMIRAVEGTIES